MPHETALIVTIAAGLGLAFLFGLLAVRLRLPLLIGYLVAGVVVGPFTPGYVADAGLAAQLAEIGVILLMFGVGLHFSVADLLAVRRIAVPGALAQIAVATGLGAVVARTWGWSWASGLVFGLCLSVASTVVLLRALADRGIVESTDGRIAVGWLIVEDLVTVLALVLLPALAGNGAGADAPRGEVLAALGVTLVKVAAFVALMLVAGRRVVPWLLERVARIESRELFTLAVLAVALGVAVGASTLFGVSFALGAFFAGVVVSESHFSHEAAMHALPLQDAFAVLFFVSVGMLFDPMILARQPAQVLAVVAIILVGKSLAAFAIVVAFGHSTRTALTISASLAQIGEFSFILAALGVSLGWLPPEAQSLVVAGALLSIGLHPVTFGAADALARQITARGWAREGVIAPPADAPAAAALRDHVVVVGSGRVGGPLASELRAHGVPYVVVEANGEAAERLREQGFAVLHGDAALPEVLRRAGLERARLVIVAAPDAYQARVMLARAHQIHPGVEVVLRARSDAERHLLEGMGAARALVAEPELAVALAREALRRSGVPHDMEAVAARIRQALGR